MGFTASGVEGVGVSFFGLRLKVEGFKFNVEGLVLTLELTTLTGGVEDRCCLRFLGFGFSDGQRFSFGAHCCARDVPVTNAGMAGINPGLEIDALTK